MNIIKKKLTPIKSNLKMSKPKKMKKVKKSVDLGKLMKVTSIKNKKLTKP